VKHKGAITGSSHLDIVTRETHADNKDKDDELTAVAH
jgi:hypothetical protein